MTPVRMSSTKRGSIKSWFLCISVVSMLLILSALLFHSLSCPTSGGFISALCNGEDKHILLSNSQHRCPIPVADDPDSVVIPIGRTSDTIPENLTYILHDTPPDGNSQTKPLFGGHQTWKQREDSFKLNATMKIHCGFIKNGGAEMDEVDVKYTQKCRFVVASGIFDGYDVPHQPSNISIRSQKLFCFSMVVDEVSLQFIKENATIRADQDGGKWVGVWRLITLHHPPYDEPRRNGKVPKILTHRLFPNAQYSIWIDGKMELIVDPLLILERYLWRGKHTFTIACHKHHKSIYEEADAIKRRKRYARPLVDLQMKIYRYEGMEMWNPLKQTRSGIATLSCHFKCSFSIWICDCAFGMMKCKKRIYL